MVSIIDSCTINNNGTLSDSIGIIYVDWRVCRQNYSTESSLVFQRIFIQVNIIINALLYTLPKIFVIEHTQTHTWPNHAPFS